MTNPADKVSFTELVAAAGRGDEEALTRLLEYCEPKFRIIARVSLGPLLRPQLDTMDLVQSMKRMLIPGLRAGLYELDSPDQLVALAATIIRRKVALYWRRQKKQAVLRLTEQALTGEEDALVEHRIQDWENEELLARLLESLTEEERQLFRMQLEGLTIVEIARHLGCRPGPLRARLSRLRKKLRSLAGISWS
ncbi:MAG: sigma-70 family RNA polymerase sigma factor [Thermogutta sp.]|nr:sigma-70 family RNA polymerase sigma factor [Thermogutta sp.]HOP78665.1 sigma-70 family RNA polymerase sigma factor [Thermogutta sp.]HPU07708.1 sigma-70 family RNA polymerase sigma factor [Thermogutta sp.]HQF12708.1 sigma-70 family RNA polymerase sigma factor [Thermogutta sp.]